MAGIEPMGTIWLLKNIPLDNTYQHTLYWSLDSGGRTEQKNYFISQSHIVRTFSDQYYTRVNRHTVRVSCLADDVLLANYLVFQNSSPDKLSPKFSNKLYYCFITAINYVNNNVTEIEFEIDVIQTWYFDYNLLPCFLERTHVRNDDLYANIVPEPVEPGEYTYDGISMDSQTSDLVIIASYVNVESGTSSGYVYGRIYGGTMLKVYETTDTVGINQLISDFVAAGKPDSIVSIYLAPKCLLVDNVVIQQGGTVLSTNMIKTTMTDLTNATPTRSLTFGSYTPHNNKLYSYPYSMLEVFTPEGASASYRYEFFNTLSHIPTFQYGGSIVAPVEVFIAPVDYKCNPDHSLQAPIYTESIALRNYPLCSWNVDAYKAWLAQNSVPIMLNTFTGAMSAAVGYRSLDNRLDTQLSVTKPKLQNRVSAMNEASRESFISGEVQNQMANVSNILTDAYRASIASDQLHGQTKGSSNVSMDIQGFFFANKVINESSARVIDAFFDMFGYAIKKIQEPIRKTRLFYTYIKTVGCVIEEKQWASNVNYGNEGIPADDANLICKLHDNGITYWDVMYLQEHGTIDGKTYHVGDYSIAEHNSPAPISPSPNT